MISGSSATARNPNDWDEVLKATWDRLSSHFEPPSEEDKRALHETAVENINGFVSMLKVIYDI